MELERLAQSEVVVVEVARCSSVLLLHCPRGKFSQCLYIDGVQEPLSSSMTVLGGLGGMRRIVAPTDSHVARCEVIRVSRRERHEWDTLLGRTAAESSSRALRYSWVGTGVEDALARTLEQASSGQSLTP